ncbi:hypothetical protein HDE_14364 [Halotydeus destructor]|nr:hypothetical protein HDE_14364 [Halotydeus destructor]
MNDLLKVCTVMNCLLIYNEASNCSEPNYRDGGPDSVFAYSRPEDRNDRKDYILASVKLDTLNFIEHGKYSIKVSSSTVYSSYVDNQRTFSDSKQTYPVHGQFFRKMEFYLFHTNGSFICFEHPQVNIYGQKFICNEYSQRFTSLTQFCSNRTVTRISGTQLFSGHFLFSIHTNDLSIVEYHQLLFDENGRLINSRTSTTQLPTALISVKDDDSVLAFFDNLVGEYKFDPKKNNLLTFNRKIDYESNKPWLACVPDVCFDGRIDSISVNHTDSRLYEMLVHRGLHEFRLEESSPKRVKPMDSLEALPVRWREMSRYIYSVDTTCIIHLPQVSLGTLNRKSCLERFPELTLISETGSHDAIFRIRETERFFVLSGSRYASYTEDRIDRDKFTYVENGFLSDLWSGLPDDIDGATQIGDDEIVFTRLHFVFITSISGMKRNSGVKQIKLIQEFFKENCTDEYYSQSKEAAQLNISTFQEFQSYRLQFLPKPKTTKSARTLATKQLKRALAGIVVYLNTRMKPAKHVASSNDILTATTTVNPSLMLLEGSSTTKYSQTTTVNLSPNDSVL